MENSKVKDNLVICGRNAVLELLKKEDSGIDKIFIKKGEREGSVKLIVAKAKEKGIPVVDAEKEKLDRMASAVHQGVVALATECAYSSVDEILEYAKNKNEAPFIAIVDKIEDPHNLGAIIRSCECAGVHGVIMSKRRCAPISAVTVKASAGAVHHMRIARVTNISSEIERLKKENIWVYASEAGGTNIYDTDLKGAVAIVFGSEGDGISRLVTEKCDFIISVPLYGNVNSLNVSCAAAVVLCEAARQRNK